MHTKRNSTTNHGKRDTAFKEATRLAYVHKYIHTNRDTSINQTERDTIINQVTRLLYNIHIKRDTTRNETKG